MCLPSEAKRMHSDTSTLDPIFSSRHAQAIWGTGWPPGCSQCPSQTGRGAQSPGQSRSGGPCRSAAGPGTPCRALWACRCPAAAFPAPAHARHQHVVTKRSMPPFVQHVPMCGGTPVMAQVLSLACHCDILIPTPRLSGFRAYTCVLMCVHSPPKNLSCSVPGQACAQTRRSKGT